METNLAAFVSFVNYDNQHPSNGNGPSIRLVLAALLGLPYRCSDLQLLRSQ